MSTTREHESCRSLKDAGHAVKKNFIPDRWSQEYKSVSALRTEAPLHALKRAIEEIGALEVERDRLREDTSLLAISLEDLQRCRRDNTKLLRQRYGLEDALLKCRKRLVELEKNV